MNLDETLDLEPKFVLVIYQRQKKLGTTTGVDGDVICIIFYALINTVVLFYNFLLLHNLTFLKLSIDSD